jgi:glutaconate CoA-transferase subunit B
MENKPRIDYVIKGISSLLQIGDRVYVGLNSIPGLLGSLMARDYYKKGIRLLGVAEADNPSVDYVTPSTGDPFMSLASPVMITPDSFDLIQKGLIDVIFLGPVQIDKYTNVNLSVIGNYEKPKVRLTGGAATAYVMPLVKKVILWNLKHSKKSLVEKVDFVTGTAWNSDNEVYVVTDLGILHFCRAKKSWEVLAHYDYSSPLEIADNTSFEVKYGSPEVISLNEDEENFINKLDPYSLRIQ